MITEIRREKAEKRKPLNAQIGNVKIYAGNAEFAAILLENKQDIIGTCKISQIEILPEKGEGRKISETSETSFVSEY